MLLIILIWCEVRAAERKIIVPRTSFDFELDARISQRSYILVELEDFVYAPQTVFSDFPSSRVHPQCSVGNCNTKMFRSAVVLENGGLLYFELGGCPQKIIEYE